MRKANEDGQFEDTCQGCDDCDCEEAEVLPSFPETVVVIPEIEGNPFKEAGLSKYSKGATVPCGSDPCWCGYECDAKTEEVIKMITEKKKLIAKRASPFNTQVGGDHYKDLVIQPTEFIMKNKLNFLEGCIIKRICRYKKKGFPLQDLRKVQHEIDMIIELEGY